MIDSLFRAIVAHPDMTFNEQAVGLVRDELAFSAPLKVGTLMDNAKADVLVSATSPRTPGA
jgi:hypothetical protein